MTADHLRTLAEKIEPRHTALLVIDMQKGYWPPRSAHQTGSEVLPPLLGLIDAARRASVPIAYIRNSFSEWVNLPPWYDLWQTSRSEGHEGYMIEGTPGVDVMDPISPQQGELVLNKHFWNVFAHSPMDLALRSKKIRTVVLTGGGILGAIESTAKDAVVRGYYAVLVADCVWPTEGTVHEVGLHYLGQRVTAQATSQEVTDCWRSRGGQE